MKKRDKKKILKYIEKIHKNLKGTIHIDELFRLIKIEEELEKEKKPRMSRLNLTLIPDP